MLDTDAPRSLADGRYLLVSPLGEGGMATVFRAYDQRLQVWRAIKMLAPHLAKKAKLRKRFENEAQMMALLEHRNIVRVYDVGTDGPHAYIIMEIVEGGCLVDWLDDNGAMPARMAVDAILQVADGVIWAHKKNVIHRDLKPHNVLITAEGICRVTDFGIARLDDDSNMTKTGAVMGTWGYMAPEQRTDAKHVDGRADLYALACTLYSLLTNKTPMDLFATDHDGEMMEGIPTDLAKLLVKATEYNKEKRHADIAEFKECLLAIRDQLPDVPADTPPLVRHIPDPPPAPDPSQFLNPPSGSESGATMAFDGDFGEAVASGAQVGAQVGAGLQQVQPSPQPRASFHAVPTISPDGPVPAFDAPTFSNDATPAPTGYSGKTLLFGAMATGLITLALGLFGATGFVLYQNQPVPVEQPIEEASPPAPKAVKAEVPPESVEEKPVVPKHSAAPAIEVKRHTTTPSLVRPTLIKPKTTPPQKRVTVASIPKAAQPLTTVKVTQADAAPANTQCIKVTPPKSIGLNVNVAFRAKLCNTDPSAALTFYYRPVGGSWSSKSMARRLGSYVAAIKTNGSYSQGIEYYVRGGGSQAGSKSHPKRAR